MKTFINNERIANLACVHYNAEPIQRGPIVYSRTHLVIDQFKKLANWGPCVLITSFSDDSVTDEMAAKLPPNVRAWFSTNVATINPRVIGMPIGLRYSLDIEEILINVMRVGRLPQRNLVYMNFIQNIPREPNPRNGLYEMFGGKKWVTMEGGGNHVPLSHFYEQISAHAYVLSPPGAGPDCHRHWEAIMLGSIPIVKRSPVTRLLDGLPCLQVDKWGHVCRGLLVDEYEKLKRLFHTPLMERVWFEYWEKRIGEA